MKSLVLSQFSLTYLPTIACCLFVILFVAMLWWTNRTESKELYTELESLPLEEGDKK